MVKPKSFGFNHETSGSNSFQNESENTAVHEIARIEFDQMVQTFIENKIDVTVFEDEINGLPDSIFPNNWLSHVPKHGLVVYPMLTENRRKEVRFDIVNKLKHQLDVMNIIDLRASIEDSLYLEGTGSIIFDHASKKAFACISPRTDLKVLNHLCELIGYDSITFESTDLNGQQIYHTNVMLSIAVKFAVVCLESIPDILERAMLKQSLERIGKEVVDISYTQMNSFGANALEVVNQEGKSFFALSQSAFDAFSADQISLIEKYTTMLPIRIKTIESVGGGSVRCMMAGLFNYPK